MKKTAAQIARRPFTRCWTYSNTKTGAIKQIRPIIQNDQIRLAR